MSLIGCQRIYTLFASQSRSRWLPFMALWMGRPPRGRGGPVRVIFQNCRFPFASEVKRNLRRNPRKEIPRCWSRTMGTMSPENVPFVVPSAGVQVPSQQGAQDRPRNRHEAPRAAKLPPLADGAEGGGDYGDGGGRGSGGGGGDRAGGEPDTVERTHRVQRRERKSWQTVGGRERTEWSRSEEVMFVGPTWKGLDSASRGGPASHVVGAFSAGRTGTWWGILRLPFLPLSPRCPSAESLTPRLTYPSMRGAP